MFIIVTGSREFTLSNLVHQCIEKALAEHGPMEIIVGDCPTGTDSFVKVAYPGCHEFKARWRRVCDEKCYHQKRYRRVGDIDIPYCPMAGHIRNQEMVDYAVRQHTSGIYLAFLKRGAQNRGTRDCIRRCKKAQITGAEFRE